VTAVNANRRDNWGDPDDNALTVLRLFPKQNVDVRIVLTLDRLRSSILRARKSDVELRDGAERGCQSGWFERTPDGGLRLLEPGSARLLLARSAIARRAEQVRKTTAHP